MDRNECCYRPFVINLTICRTLYQLENFKCSKLKTTFTGMKLFVEARILRDLWPLRPEVLLQVGNDILEVQVLESNRFTSNRYDKG